jgi:hypothetical protein
MPTESNKSVVLTALKPIAIVLAVILLFIYWAYQT